MAAKNKKICLILNGGTILSEKDNFFVTRKSDINDWLNKMPELFIMGDIKTKFINGEKEREYGEKVWKKINDTIYKNLDEFDGFIVTNCVDDILYNAIAASFALKNINKPVVFTGSQLPLIDKKFLSSKKKTYGGLGVKANLINAVQLATMEIPAVGIMFGNSFIKAVKAQRSAVYALNIFSSSDGKYLAKIDFGISSQEKIRKSDSIVSLINNFESNIICLKYFPGFNLDLVKESISKSKGIFLETMADHSLDINFLNEINKLDIPFVLFNKFYAEGTDLENSISLSQITKESALVKFMWVLGQTDKISKISELMFKEQCQEFIK